ncbi:MAG TPA: alpha/beta hydrolase [Streptosporangiaceae bacterium]|nr:alpha/beta hydrolase [Streptosporangiaceae bacterium]
MRFRRAAAVAAAAAAVLATTAAILPAGQHDRLQPLPALTARALAARYAADSSAVARAAQAASQTGDTGRAYALAAIRGGHFLSFDPRGQGEAVEVFGNLQRARRVAILVPGSDTSLTTFSSRGTASPAGGAKALAAEAHRLDPRARLTVIAWLGYATPATLSPAILTSGDAGQGAQSLRPLVDALARHGDQVALLCHSYGSVVCGLAAPHLPVTDITAFGSPGMDAPSAGSLHTTARVWAGRGANDWIGNVPHLHLLGLGFGQDPTAPAFGARLFDCGQAGHSGYFRPGGIALRNLAYIALGHPAQVTR